MKKIKVIILLLLYTITCITFRRVYASDKQIGQDEKGQESKMERFLKADGKVLRNNYGKGDVVTLIGTNVGGWQVMEGWMCPTNSKDQITTIETLTNRFSKEVADELIKVYEDHWFKEEDFDNIASLNFNVLRLPISYLNLLDENGLLREDTLATYDWFVAECEKRDIYVILDLHAAPGSQNGKDHSGDTSGSKLYTSNEFMDLTVSLWEQLATHYKGNPTIAGYDLLNEPEGTNEEKSPWGKVQIPFYDRLYKAIREIDKEHIIILESIWEPTDMPDPSVYGWENVMYEYHYYGWDGIDDATKQKRFTNSKVELTNKANFNVPVLIGEFTLFSNLSSWVHGLKVYDENGWSYTTWTYKTVEYGNWGIYTSRKSDTPEVNIYTDSLEVIKEKWSKVDTKTSFRKNTYLYDVLRVMADKELAEKNPKTWYQNYTTDITFYGSKDALVSLVKGEEITKALGEQHVIKLELSESSLVNNFRYAYIPPTIRNTVDATGMDYLMFDTLVRKGIQSMDVILVDKDGGTWTSKTSNSVTPITHSWEKLFVDISKATIDKSAIAYIGIGNSVAGTYYIKDIYFGVSYASDLPTESVADMKESMGEEISPLKFNFIKSDEVVSNRSRKNLIAFIVAAISVAIGGFVVLIKLFRKPKK